MSDLLSIPQLVRSLGLLDLRLVEHRGCFINREAFSEEAVNAWLERTGGDVRAVERTLNHVHLYDCVGPYEETQLSDLEAIAQQVKAVWHDLLLVRLPARTFEVSFASEPDEYGPTLTVCQTERTGLVR